MNGPDPIPLPLPDAADRSRIRADLKTNLFVEAGAGSGKTTELVTRMVALVASGTAPVERIAAVTFTRKAASELRERFQIRLEEEIAAADPHGPLASALRSALDGIDRCFVGTIHAFCARLLRERPLEAGLDPGFEELPAEERKVLRRRFWDAYLERLVRDQDPALEELADAGLSPTRLYGVFETLVENSDVHFPAREVRPPSGDEIAEVRTALERLVERAAELLPAAEPAGEWGPLQKKLRTLRFTKDVTAWERPADLFEAIDVLSKRSAGRSQAVTSLVNRSDRRTSSRRSTC